jgi:SAM-dependent methyltransferase
MINRGILAQSTGELFGNKIFYLMKGRRHWVPNKAWMDENNFVFPEEVILLSDDVLLAFLPGQPASRVLDPQIALISNVGEAREVAASQCRGSGLEIGAGSSPFPVPLGCTIQYGDIYSYDELLQNAYPGQPLHDIVAPTIKTELDNLQNVANDSLDFLVACHVIEHTRDPIGAIQKAYSKLKKGGQLVLVIPNMTRTFDRKRPVTTLEHLIEDFKCYDIERDQAHYREFFALAEGFSVPDEELEAKWREEWERDYSIHFHTWTYESFGSMVNWIISNAAPYSGRWSHDTLPDGIEFYFTLTK